MPIKRIAAERRRWHAAPLLRISLAWHCAAALLTLLRPQWWPWTLGAVIANHLTLTALGLWPRSQWLGSNWTRLPPRAAARGAVAITIDDGPDPEITPLVLAILAEHGAHATFFCVGQRAGQTPDIVRACIAQGHAVENHSDRHAHSFSLFGMGAQRRELECAQRTIERVSGSAPRFFRAPAGLRNIFLDPVLQQLGLQLVSWTRRGFDTVNANADAVYRRLAGPVQGGGILLLHDGNAARSRSGKPVILEVLPRLLDALAALQLRPVTLRSAIPR